MKTKISLFLALGLLLLMPNFQFVPFVYASPGPDVAAYYPTGYNLLGSTTYVSGQLSDLQSDNSVYMSFRSFYSGTDSSDFVDNNTSDVDSSPDKGTHSNFTAQQFGSDSIYDTLTEENTGGAMAIAKVGTDTSGTGNALTLSFSHTLVAGLNRLVIVAIGIENGGTIDVDSVTYGGVAMTKAVEGITGISGYRFLAEIWYILENDLPSDGSKTVQITCSGTATGLEINGFCAEYTGVNQSGPEATDNTDEPSPADATIENTISPSDGSWVISGVGCGNSGSFTHGQGQVEVLDFRDSSSTFAVAELRGASGETSLSSTYSATANRLERVAAAWNASVEVNYELDLEVQWTSATYDLPNEELCIYGGTMGSEDVGVDVWTGSVWQNLFTDLTNGWNNISISSYLTSSTFTIRFKGGTEEGDTTQDNWNIDVTLLHVWSDQYTMEVEFTGSSNVYEWTQLVWTVDSAWTAASVTVTLQLYNYTQGAYSTSGDGYTSYISSATANTDETKSQTITANPTHFRDGAGNWKIKIKGVRSTSLQFDFKGDLIKFEVTYVPPDTAPPTWSNAGTNNTDAGEATLFYVKWTDNAGLSGFIFGTNNTGTWLNDTWAPMTGLNNWSNVTKVLNSTIGVVVQWQVWTNDTSNNWNTTGILSLTTTGVLGYALNLRIKDWDLTDPISNAYVYVDSNVKTSDSNGWTNWTQLTGTVQIKVKWYGSWVNGTFSVTMNADKTIEVRCNIFDIEVKTTEPVQGALLQYANVTVYNGTSVESNKIRTGMTGADGKVILLNVPNSSLTFTVYDGASLQHVIANITRTIVLENQAETIVCDQNYVSVTGSWSIIGSYSTASIIGSSLCVVFSLFYAKRLKERINTVRSKHKVKKAKESERIHEASI